MSLHFKRNTLQRRLIHPWMEGTPLTASDWRTLLLAPNVSRGFKKTRCLGWLTLASIYTWSLREILPMAVLLPLGWQKRASFTCFWRVNLGLGAAQTAVPQRTPARVRAAVIAQPWHWDVQEEMELESQLPALPLHHPHKWHRNHGVLCQVTTFLHICKSEKI